MACRCKLVLIDRPQLITVPACQPSVIAIIHPSYGISKSGRVGSIPVMNHTFVCMPSGRFPIHQRFQCLTLRCAQTVRCAIAGQIILDAAPSVGVCQLVLHPSAPGPVYTMAAVSGTVAVNNLGIIISTCLVNYNQAKIVYVTWFICHVVAAARTVKSWRHHIV